MEKSKIEIKVGIVEFTGEGEQEWLGKQLDKVLERVPELLKIELAAPTTNVDTGNQPTEPSQGAQSVTSNSSNSVPSNLSTYLRDKNATSNQMNKFLVTATFLQLRGQRRISTGDVTQALKDSNQSRLGNASDKLNKNVGKGYCEKDGSQFFVTQEGLDFVESMQ